MGATASYEDAAEGDGNLDGGYELTPEQAAQIMADPDIAPSTRRATRGRERGTRRRHELDGRGRHPLAAAVN